MSTAAAPAGAVLADLLPTSRVRDAALVAGGAVLTGLAAQIAVPVPGSPVPVTGQTFAALLVGTALGARRGFAALALYAVVGMAGLPWFAGGASGYALPSLGYVLGMLLAATAVGALARRGADRSVWRMAAPWPRAPRSSTRSASRTWRWRRAWACPRRSPQEWSLFLLGDALKAALAMGLLPDRLEARGPPRLTPLRAAGHAAPADPQGHRRTAPAPAPGAAGGACGPVHLTRQRAPAPARPARPGSPPPP